MLNQAQIIGHVGREPDVRALQNGDPVVALSIATTEKWKDKVTGEKREATEWHRIVLFGKLAEIAQQFVRKGTLVYVSGKIMHKKYQDKEGVEKYITEIRADALKLLSKSLSDQSAPSKVQSKSPDIADMDDDIPF
jgi:single-strand DNA-binding protein